MAAFRTFLEHQDLPSFYAAHLENPYDKLPLLIFADWLDEHGDPLGEMIRKTIEYGGKDSKAKARWWEVARSVEKGLQEQNVRLLSFSQWGVSNKAGTSEIYYRTMGKTMEVQGPDGWVAVPRSQWTPLLVRAALATILSSPIRAGHFRGDFSANSFRHELEYLRDRLTMGTNYDDPNSASYRERLKAYQRLGQLLPQSEHLPNRMTPAVIEILQVIAAEAHTDSVSATASPELAKSAQAVIDVLWPRSRPA